MNVLDKPLHITAYAVLTRFLTLNSIFLKHEKFTAMYVKGTVKRETKGFYLFFSILITSDLVTIGYGMSPISITVMFLS